jgi:hypothetical protein
MERTDQGSTQCWEDYGEHTAEIARGPRARGTRRTFVHASAPAARGPRISRTRALRSYHVTYSLNTLQSIYMPTAMKPMRKFRRYYMR